jgi:hypothetical protein
MLANITPALTAQAQARTGNRMNSGSIFLVTRYLLAVLVSLTSGEVGIRFVQRTQSIDMKRRPMHCRIDLNIA